MIFHLDPKTPLLLHDDLLRAAEIVIGLLERAVELRVMRGQGNVLAELPEKSVESVWLGEGAF